MPFVLNDDNYVNTYGFSVLTSGIDLSAFEDNPVMLESHRNDADYTIGRWINLTAEESRLLADPEFDEEDEGRARKVKSKVDRGFIKGASIGITFDPDKLLLVAGRLMLTACRLLEASIVPVPSNSGAIRLFSVEGKPLEDAEVREMCLSIQNVQNVKNHKMKKFTISLAALAALGFEDSEQVEETKLSSKIEALAAANASLSAKLKEMNDAAEAALAAKRTAMVDNAIKDGRITADKKEAFLKLATADFALAETTLSALPKKQSFAGSEQPAQGEDMTMEKFQKLSVAEQLAFKNDQPELYKKLINKK
ncbi:MAG: caudovirus prohead protease [Bacteroidetes bacterium]|nr:caudovirus prohead protease [Bacteroidota bacterium]